MEVHHSIHTIHLYVKTLPDGRSVVNGGQRRAQRASADYAVFGNQVRHTGTASRSAWQ